MTSNDLTQGQWEAARLIPVSGIRGADEQERRGVSALLATLVAVKEFGHAIVVPLGAPKGRLSAYIEVTFQLGKRNVRPDGLIRVTRGATEWTALVEVKTGRNELQAAQIEDYIEVARQNHFDAVLTISNQLTIAPGEHPARVDKKNLKKVTLAHLSWSRIHTEAVIERVNRAVSDPDQAWILTELIRYLEHPRSGAVDFDDMGESWVAVRDGIKNRTMRTADQAATDVVLRFGQLLTFAGMRMSRKLGVEVRPALTRSQLQDLAAYNRSAIELLVDKGILRGSLRVPDTATPIDIIADLRAGQVSCRATIDAPERGRNVTRVKWLLRQLTAAPDDLIVEAKAARSRHPGPSCRLAEVRLDPAAPVDDPARELRSFAVRMVRPAGTKRGQGRGSFVGSVLQLVDDFYDLVVQHLKQWTPPAPSVKAVDTDLPQHDGVSGQLPSKAGEGRPASWGGDRDAGVAGLPSVADAGIGTVAADGADRRTNPITVVSIDLPGPLFGHRDSRDLPGSGSGSVGRASSVGEDHPEWDGEQIPSQTDPER